MTDVDVVSFARGPTEGKYGLNAPNSKQDEHEKTAGPWSNLTVNFAVEVAIAPWDQSDAYLLSRCAWK